MWCWRAHKPIAHNSFLKAKSPPIHAQFFEGNQTLKIKYNHTITMAHFQSPCSPLKSNLRHKPKFIVFEQCKFLSGFGVSNTTIRKQGNSFCVIRFNQILFFHAIEINEELLQIYWSMDAHKVCQHPQCVVSFIVRGVSRVYVFVVYLSNQVQEE